MALMRANQIVRINRDFKMDVIEKNINIGGLFVDPIPNFPNQHQKNFMADSRENCSRNLGSEKVKE